MKSYINGSDDSLIIEIGGSVSGEEYKFNHVLALQKVGRVPARHQQQIC